MNVPRILGNAVKKFHYVLHLSMDMTELVDLKEGFQENSIELFLIIWTIWLTSV